jgi:hypothetical protein
VRASPPPHICQRVRQSTVPGQLPPRHQLVDGTLARRSRRNGWPRIKRSPALAGADASPLSLALRLLARIVLLDLAVFFIGGLRSGWIGAYVAVYRPVQASSARLARRLFAKLGHPIEPVREIEQFLSDFQALCLPR